MGAAVPERSSRVKRKLAAFLAAAAAATGILIVSQVGTASAAYPCAGAGGAVGATTGHGAGGTQVTVYCGNGTKEIFFWAD
jgi:hypothetical protein